MSGATNMDELTTFSEVNSIGNFHCSCNYHTIKNDISKNKECQQECPSNSYLLLKLPEKVWIRRLFRKSMRQ